MTEIEEIKKRITETQVQMQEHTHGSDDERKRLRELEQQLAILEGEILTEEFDEVFDSSHFDSTVEHLFDSAIRYYGHKGDHGSAGVRIVTNKEKMKEYLLKELRSKAESIDGWIKAVENEGWE